VALPKVCSMRWKVWLLAWITTCACASAGPLMTEEYPMWVQDAVRSLRAQGLISAGCLPAQALARSDMMPLLQKFVELQQEQLQPYAGKNDLSEIRALLESLLESTADLERRTQDVHPPVINK